MMLSYSPLVKLCTYGYSFVLAILGNTVIINSNNARSDSELVTVNNDHMHGVHDERLVAPS